MKSLKMALVGGQPAAAGGFRIWEENEIFRFLVTSNLFKDPKTIVDLPLRSSLSQLRAEFADSVLPYLAQGHPVPRDVADFFIAQHFTQPSSTLSAYVHDYAKFEGSSFMPFLKKHRLKAWAFAIRSIWQELARSTALCATITPNRHSKIALPHGFIMPGSRFREVYYWDTYWVIRGLIVSDMVPLAKELVENLLWLIQRFSFVPNGSRWYYTNRSQPPLLSEMVRVVYEATEDKDLLARAIEILQREYKYWTQDPHSVLVAGATGKIHRLSRYYALWDKPRPESQCFDEKEAQGFSSTEAAQLYREIASGAETGWDFSSRWMADGKSMRTLRTTLIVPTDLNAFLLQMERNIASFAACLGPEYAATRAKFCCRAEIRRGALDALLWNEERGQWLDYWLDGTKDSEGVWRSGHQNVQTFASNFVPLWCGALQDGNGSWDMERAEKVVEAFKLSGLLQVGGVATSMNPSGHQWDFPNAWPPLQHILAEGFRNVPTPTGTSVAEDIATRAIQTMLVAYENTGFMHEKYESSQVGGIGGGGEYLPQVGFGWSNGVALALLKEFHSSLSASIPDYCEETAHDSEEKLHPLQPKEKAGPSLM
eukprot:TRINITY_DN2558_c0_g1_i5.p1 TRINITY_DN2558_c0_g1~~TRINITY_DN2558_c0_g1_i5.p1  ORF type:complete len:597 (-),score=60.28 TRINITY_DN2558_c0_g1_i5:501-2291(-)